jgi:hypothetical protein
LARSSRTGNQCQRPALAASTSQKCQYHGGRGSGPKTPEGKARIAAAHTVHGQETAKARAARSAASAKLSALEDAMHILGMTNAPRTRGRKADGYRPVRNLSDLQNLVMDTG